MTTEYYDLSAATDGTGSIVNPYNTVSHINSYNGGGDLGGRVFALKANGAIKREGIILNNVSNFQIGYYGSGDRAVFDGSDIITPTWVWDAVNSLWYFESTENMGLFANGVQMLDMLSLAYCQANINGSFFDSVSNPKRLYVNTGGALPSGIQWEAVRSAALGGRQSGVAIIGVSNLIIDHIAAARNYNSNFSLSSVGSGLTIRNCKAEYAGGWVLTGVGRDGFVIYGTQGAGGIIGTYATNLVVQNNESNHNQNNSYEFWGVDGAIVEGNVGSNCSGFELWGYVKNSIFTGNKLTDLGLGKFPVGNTQASMNTHQSGIWISNPVALGTYNQGWSVNNTFDANIFTTNTGNGAWIESGNGHKFRNNTFVVRTSRTSKGTSSVKARYVLYGTDGFAVDGVHTGIAEWKNNICYEVLNNDGSYNYTIFRTASGVTFASSDYNDWYMSGIGNNFGSAIVAGAAGVSGFANFKTATGTDAASLNSDPLMTSQTTNDLSLQSGSPCRGAGTPWFNGVPIPRTYQGNLFNPSSPDIGGWQNVSALDPSVTTQAPGGGY